MNPQPLASILRRRAPALLLAAALCAALTGVALAEDCYDPSNDKHVYTNSNATDASVLPVERVHEVTFGTMPEVRERVEENTGKETSYSLVWIHHGDDAMAVDPFRFNR